jgi:hypothetical protein
MILETQISSKYSPDNARGVFFYKDRLSSVAVTTAFPAGEQILVYSHGFAITTPEESVVPFDRTQVDFFRKVKKNPVHVVYNVNNKDTGYLGESASVETAYALTLGKPIFMMDRHNLHFGDKVDPAIARIVDKNRIRMRTMSPLVWGIEAYDENHVSDYLYDVAAGRYGYPDYNITEQDEGVVMKNVLSLTRKYRETWNEFKAAC